MTLGKLRFWFSGVGRLLEKPDLEVRATDSGAPAESYYDLDLETLGSPNDNTLETVEELALCRRYVMSSLKLYTISVELARKLVGMRYRRGVLTLTHAGNAYTLWGHNPFELLAEAKLLDEGTSSGWVLDEVIVEEILPEGSLVKTTNLITTTHVLREKPVVDLMAVVGQQIRARLYLVGSVCVLCGFAIGHFLR
jgi:hypothetical protein